MMKKRLNGVCVLLTTLLLQVAWASPPVDLTVFSAHSGEIKKVSDDGYTLTIERTAIGYMLPLMNPPNCIGRFITGQQLSDQWSVGKESYVGESMGAVLVVPGINFAGTINLIEDVRTKDEVIFKFKRVSWAMGEGHSSNLCQDHCVIGTFSLFIGERSAQQCTLLEPGPVIVKPLDKSDQLPIALEPGPVIVKPSDKSDQLPRALPADTN